MQKAHRMPQTHGHVLELLGKVPCHSLVLLHRLLSVAAGYQGEMKSVLQVKS